MTQFEDISSLLGKASDSSEVRELLRHAGVKDPRLKKGDVKAWAELKKLGVSLIFTDEAYLTKQDDLAIGEGALVLTNIRFYSDDVSEYSTFEGILPFGVKFTQSQRELVAMLGKPEWSNADLGMDRWSIDDKWFFARYLPEFDRILDCGVQVPDPK